MSRAILLLAARRLFRPTRKPRIRRRPTVRLGNLLENESRIAAGSVLTLDGVVGDPETGESEPTLPSGTISSESEPGSSTELLGTPSATGGSAEEARYQAQSESAVSQRENTIPFTSFDDFSLATIAWDPASMISPPAMDTAGDSSSGSSSGNSGSGSASGSPGLQSDAETASSSSPDQAAFDSTGAPVERAGASRPVTARTVAGPATAHSSALGVDAGSPALDRVNRAPARVWVESVDGAIGRGFRIWRDVSRGDLSVRYRLSGGPAGGSAVKQVVITDGNRSEAVVVPGGADAKLTLLAGNGYLVAAANSGCLNGAPAATPAVSVRADSSTILAGSGDAGWVTFSRTTTVGDLAVNYAIGGTAIAGVDFQPLSGRVVIPDGQMQATVAICPLADAPLHGHQTVEVSVEGGDGYDVALGGRAEVMIQDPSSGEPIVPRAGTVGGPADGGWSSNPVRYSDGKVWYQTVDLESDGFGGPWRVKRSWSNLAGFANDAYIGNGWIDYNAPRLLPEPQPLTGVVLVKGGDQSIWFDKVSGNYVPEYFTTDQLAFDSTKNQFVLTEADGNRWIFSDPSDTSLPELRRGQLEGYSDRYGNCTQVTGWRQDGKPNDVQRDYMSGGTTTTESFLYAYVSGGTNDALLASVTLRRKVGSGSWTTIRKVEYTYYDGTSSNGNPGDLEYAVVKDPSGNALSSEYCRYYLDDSTTGFADALKYAFRGDSYTRLKAWADDNSTTVDAATDSQVAPFADHYFEYDSSSKRATKEVAKGAGDSTTSGGRGTFTFSYTTSSNTNGLNNWKLKTVETLPDGNQNIVYTNFLGGVLLSAFRNVATGDQWITYNHFNTQGRIVWTAYPSAVTGYSDSNADLMNFSLGTSSYLRDDAGLFQIRDYYSSTTASSTSPGGVTDYLEDSKIRRGELGTPVLQNTLQYFSESDGTTAIYPIATDTVYRNDDGTGGQTTSCSYSWAGAYGPQSITATLPAVTTSQNGSGSAMSLTTVFDSFGNPIWFKDGDGYLHYRAYDLSTGAVVKSIEDVDTTQTSTFANLPSGWSTPSGGGLHPTTTADVDGLGRTTAVTDPNGNVGYYTFDDINHEIRHYPGWNGTTNAPTGPTEVRRDDWAKGYTEILTMSATPALSSGKPTGTESISGVQTLARDYFNTGGQLTDRDSYFDLTGLTYSTSTSLGSEGTNFNRTRYGYDANGLPNRMVSPAGTIYRMWRDALGRDSSDWVGLDDTPTSGAWSPSNTSGTDLVKMADSQYDGGGIGDGTLTKYTEYPGGSAAARESDFYFDWRDRLVAVKDGVETSESTSVNRPIQYFNLDNLGEITKERTYDGDGVTLTTTDGDPDAPSSSLLRAQVAHSFDEIGQEYKTQVYSVNPSSGSVSTNALATNYWFDGRGNTIKEADPGGLVTKIAFDGDSRPATVYSTDGGGDSGYSDASNVTGDAVLNQVSYSYDANGNVILAVNRDRFHDETGTGALGTPTSGVHARVSYEGYYYDAVDRLTASVDVGTNGGSTWTRPSSVPSRSDTVLVNSFAYNSAGWQSDQTDPLGILDKTYYDAAGDVTKTIENYVDGTVSDADDKTVEFGFNANGQATTTKLDLTGGSSETTAYVYGVTTSGGNGLNSNDVLAAIQYPDPSTGSASSSQQVSLTVNALGEPLTRTDRNGSVHTYSYDTVGRLTTDAVTTLGSGVDGSVRRIEFAYDGQGIPYLVTSYDAASGGNVVNQVKQEFNGLGQLTSDWQEHSGSVTTSSPRVQYAHTEMASGANHSRPTSMTYPNGKELDYNYASGLSDSISRLSSISDSTGTLESYDYLGLDTVVRRAHSQPGVDLTYIKLTGESNGDAGDQYVGLDRFGRVVDQRWLKTSNGTATDRFQYGYDRDGDPMWRDNLVHSSAGELYSYDGFNQLTSFSRGTLNSGRTAITGTPSRTQSWDFDALGNFDSETTDGTTVTRSANKQNEITSISGATTPTYDANGNLTGDETGRTFKYDAWDRLISVKNSSGTTIASYAYDGLDRRVTETHGSTTTDLYYNDQWQVIEERVSGQATAQYVWSPVGIDALVLRDRDTDGNGSLDERLWVQQDANGNVTALLDNSGDVVERYLYDPFGNVTVLDGSWNVRTGGSAYDWHYLFQGFRRDPATGLDDARHREIDAALGRPLQTDPLGFEAGDVNLYRWEGNRPGAVRDPSGLAWTIPAVAMPGTTAQQRLRLARAIFDGLPKTVHTEGIWGGRDKPIEFQFNPEMYGADGDLTVDQLGGAIIEELNQFEQHMAQYALEQALMALLGPVFSKIAALAIKGGWKLLKVGGKYFLKHPETGKICRIDGCFAAGTPILTPGGDKPIEEIKRGDVVLARDEEDPSAAVQARIVEAVFQRTAPVMSLTIGGYQVRLTEEHPFYTLSRGWTAAHELLAGDWVLGATSEWLPIGKVESAGEMEVVYNMCVSGAHTFFIGKRNWGFAVWVHNAPHGLPCFGDHMHHTIPHEIQKKLPPHLQNDPDIIGRPGLPNRKPVEAGKHLGEVHDKTGISPKETGIYGGRYNLRFHEEIMKRGGYDKITKKDLLEIRDLLVKEFGL